MLDRLFFILSETLTSLRRHGMLQVAAVSTACVALILLGSVGMMLYKLDAIAQSLPRQFEMEVFLKPEVPRERTLALQKQVEAMPAVASVQLVPREQAWEEEKKRYASEVNLSDLPNPLPDKLIVRTDQPEQLPQVAARLQNHPDVDEVLDQRGTLERVLAVARLVRWLGLSLVSMLLLSALVLIYNAVRLTIFARQLEVRIMALVGATLRTIRMPFILEGMVQGGLGGVLAAGLVLMGAGLLSDYMLRLWPFLNDLPPGAPATLVLGGLPTLGMLLGGLCAWWAARRFVRIG
ncbi:Cell division protein FtsX [bacterium HR15]|nr:Cell division protein FtsX [bacterium HR15]